MFWMGQILSHREVWRSAIRQVFRRRIVRVSFVILTLYTLVAILDSIGYHPPLRDDDGSLRRHTERGHVLFDREGQSVLDLILTPLRNMEEKTYSAPLATAQFTMETLYNDDGTTSRGYPPLRYPRRHLLGTDRVGNDVLLLAIKGIRTGMIIGGFTTLLVIPFAILFGVTAGYLRGWVDDLIQYIYTVLSSIPSLLLIISFMIVFGRGLTQLCIIMGITSWTGLCRVLRGETLKLRELEYVQAAEAMGVSRPRIMLQHIVPNLMHIVLITAVLSFSGRVLAEAVLSYIGIGVGAETMSWGTMINDARQELARAPIIWWKLVAAFIFMVGLVLPANLFGDAIRDALDPRLRTE
ncbi:MAG: ABC transporter permease [Lentisphaerae bacterium]|nr:ABC transporter permease [Lentisphaerota bacterium]